MIKFKKKKLYDAELGDTGIWTSLVISGVDSGYKVKVKYWNSRDEVRSAQITRVHAQERRRLGVDDLTGLQALRANLAYFILADWKGVEDEADRPVPFTPENAMAWLEDEDQTIFVIPIWEKANDLSLFPVDDADPAGPVTKN